MVFDPPLSEPISETIISLPSLNLWHVYHAMLELRAFLFQKEISCYSGVTVAHLSGKQAVFFVVVILVRKIEKRLREEVERYCVKRLIFSFHVNTVTMVFDL